MVEHKCIRCRKTFTKKSTFVDHTKRKNPCHKISTKNPPTNSSVSTKSNQKMHQCPNCKSVFTRSDALKRHVEHRCKQKKEKKAIDSENQLLIKEILEEMKQIREENHELRNKNLELENKLLQIEKNKSGDVINSHNIITDLSTNTQNIVNNFNIVAFGKEALDKDVPEDVCETIFLKGFEAVPFLVKYIHFNEKMPEYQNCYISNMRDKHAITYDGKKWNLTEATEVLKTIREDKQTFLENKFEAFYDSLDELTRKKFNKFLAEKDSDEMAERYKESLRLLLYNNRGMVVATKKKLEMITKNKLNDRKVPVLN